MKLKTFSLIILCLTMASCRQKTSHQSVDPISNSLNHQITSDDKNQQYENLITFATYSYDEEGLPTNGDNITNYHYLTSTSTQELSTTELNPGFKLDEDLKQYTIDANNILANLNNHLIFTNIINNQNIEEGCYYSAYNNATGYFFLDLYKRIEPYIVSISYEKSISLSGLICVDEAAKLISFASNDFFVDAEEGLINLRKILAQLGVQLDEEDESFGLIGLRTFLNRSRSLNNPSPPMSRSPSINWSFFTRTRS